MTCQYPVNIPSISCQYPVNIPSISRLFPANILSISRHHIRSNLSNKMRKNWFVWGKRITNLLKSAILSTSAITILCCVNKWASRGLFSSFLTQGKVSVHNKHSRKSSPSLFDFFFSSRVMVFMEIGFRMCGVSQQSASVGTWNVKFFHIQVFQGSGIGSRGDLENIVLYCIVKPGAMPGFSFIDMVIG